MKIVYILPFNLFYILFFAQKQYPENKEGIYKDMLTPKYYLSEKGTLCRTQINAFVCFACQILSQYSLSDSLLRKIVSIYAHPDLDLDSAQHLNLEGKTVK